MNYIIPSSASSIVSNHQIPKPNPKTSLRDAYMALQEAGLHPAGEKGAFPSLLGLPLFSSPWSFHVVSIAKWYNDLDDLGYPYFRKP
jgi:hypothetical protein